MLVKRFSENVISIKEIPVISFDHLLSSVKELFTDSSKESDNVPLAYFVSDNKLYILILDYISGNYKIAFSSLRNAELDSMQCDALYQFERDIYERSNIKICGHPYLKPLKRPYEKSEKFDFEKNPNISLHEVNVGPVHAGIIEPGQFRFICQGELVKSVEVCLGFQRRGIEKLIVESNSNRKRILLSEQIAGDSVIANSIAMVNILESAVEEKSAVLLHERALALEMERIAMHLADIAAIAQDSAYYLGQIAVEPLRTIIINSMQLWCGSRSGRGLVRPAGAFYRLSLNDIETLTANIEKVKSQFKDISSNLLSSPSLLARLDGKCVLSKASVRKFALRGIVAKASSFTRDVRIHQSDDLYVNFKPKYLSKGDNLSRLHIRILEVGQSLDYALESLSKIKSMWHADVNLPDYNIKLPMNSLILSPVEGFRGTILHLALTNSKGDIKDYRIFDPSLQLWPVLAYVMKDQQISDFPICNKSFNLSYLANDL